MQLIKKESINKVGYHPTVKTRGMVALNLVKE